MGAPVRQTPSQPGTAAGGGGNQGGSSAVGATKMAADVVSACLQWWQRACTNRHGSRGQARVLPGWGAVQRQLSRLPLPPGGGSKGSHTCNDKGAARCSVL